MLLAYLSSCLQSIPLLSSIMISERANGAEKASCRETVVEKGVFGESIFFSAPLRVALKTPENLRID